MPGERTSHQGETELVISESYACRTYNAPSSTENGAFVIGIRAA